MKIFEKLEEEIKNEKIEPATYQDLCALPDHMIGEIVGGELFASPRPALPHASSASRMGFKLGGGFDGPSGGGPHQPGGWIILFEPEIHFGEDVVVPDLAGWRRERLPQVPNAPYMELAPDWVCEVVSPQSGRLDRIKKSQVYAREKIAHFWIVDPLQKTLEVYELKGDKWLLIDSFEGNQKARVKPFDAIELDFSNWWIE